MENEPGYGGIGEIHPECPIAFCRDLPLAPLDDGSHGLFHVLRQFRDRPNLIARGEEHLKRSVTRIVITLLSAE